MSKPVFLSSVTSKDFSLFREVLDKECETLKDWFNEKEFSEDREKIGAELEFQLFTEKYQPANLANEFIEKSGKSYLVSEAGLSNVEINTPFFDLEGKVLEKLSNSLTECCHFSHTLASSENLIPAALGLLFSVSDISVLKMNSTPRFKIMEESLKKLRKNKLISVAIDGNDHLELNLDNTAIMLAATNAFQLHMQVKFSQSVHFYNAAQIIAAPMLACSVASPFFFGKKLWQETRIPLLEQLSVHENNLNRVEFGDDYIHDTLFEFFLRNQAYPSVVPAINHHDLDSLWHLRLHGSTIYRWNRPLVGFNGSGSPHLRIEYRTLSAGPSIQDMIANTALLIGSVFALGTNAKHLEHELSFFNIKNNFYQAAKHGLDADFLWTGNDTLSAVDVLNHIILPLAQEGLEKMDISKSDSDFYLEIIRERIKSKKTCSSWLIDFIDKHDCTFDDLLRVYVTNQRKNEPIHEWKLY